MRKLLNNPWFVAVMALAALALVAHTVFSRDEESGFAGSDVAVAEAEETVVTEETLKVPARQVVQSLPATSLVRDPFAMREKTEAVAQTEALPDVVDKVHLSAIWTQDGHTLVLINDHICQGGDEIGRVKIESATAEGVWISHWKGRDFLAIGGNFVLSTPASRFSPTVSSL